MRMTNDEKEKARDEKISDLVIRFANDMHSVSFDELYKAGREANYELRNQKFRHSYLSAMEAVGNTTQKIVDNCEADLTKAEAVKSSVVIMLKVKHQYTQEEV